MCSASFAEKVGPFVGAEALDPSHATEDFARKRAELNLHAANSLINILEELSTKLRAYETFRAA